MSGLFVVETTISQLHTFCSQRAAIPKNAVLIDPLCYRPVMNEEWKLVWCQKPLLPLTHLG